MEEITIFNLIKYVRSALTSNTELTQLVDNQIFAMEGKEGIHYPFITITKQGASETRNKDYVTGYSCVVNITMWHTNYSKLCDMAKIVYDTMDEYFSHAKTTAVLTDNYDDVDTEDGCWMSVLQYSFSL